MNWLRSTPLCQILLPLNTSNDSLEQRCDPLHAVQTYLYLWRPLQAVKHSTQHLEDRRGQQNTQHIHEHRKHTSKNVCGKESFLKRWMFIPLWDLFFYGDCTSDRASDRQTELSEPTVRSYIIWNLALPPERTCTRREVAMATEPEGPVNQSGLI